MARQNPRVANKRHLSKITKRGNVETRKKETKPPVGPWVLGLFLFVVVGSALFQIIRTA
eukprot:CAMPEP_0183357322 /NCGR_PEP_ID=MMETSP0164_2-20130417/45909_1 /TAXON_ID=221442 /ORGANISM="Coccolithus pelagicus ssp braarudi, Strain PLY182g" /LENGTH=58 /DNA_ID=CAMNT_0025530911 /DNA_START=15 /DNA_END=187 /DNA_ORIENTATION=+